MPGPRWPRTRCSRAETSACAPWSTRRRTAGDQSTSTGAGPSARGQWLRRPRSIFIANGSNGADSADGADLDRRQAREIGLSVAHRLLERGAADLLPRPWKPTMMTESKQEAKPLTGWRVLVPRGGPWATASPEPARPGRGAGGRPLINFMHPRTTRRFRRRAREARGRGVRLAHDHQCHHGGRAVRAPCSDPLLHPDRRSRRRPLGRGPRPSATTSISCRRTTTRPRAWRGRSSISNPSRSGS